MAVITGTRALVILLQQTALLLTPIDAWQSVPTLPCRTRGSTLFSSRVCPNTTAECVCSTLAQGIAINWSLPAGNCPSNSILLSQSAETDCGMKHDACGAFEATNQIPPAGQPCTTSVLTVMASPTLSGAAVMCFSITSTQTILNGAAFILLLELPDPPVVSVIPSLDGETLVVNCSHAVTGGTPDSYVIKMTSTTTKTVAAINGNVIATFSQLTQNTTYSIRVTAANCAGHSGETEVNATTATIEQVIPPSDNGQASSNVVSIAADVSVCAVAAMAVVLMCATVVLLRRHWKRHTKNLLERRSVSEVSAHLRWRDIGRNLGFTHSELSAIVPKGGLTGPQHYFEEMLDQWLKWAPPNKKYPCTEDLVAALRQVGEHNLALKLEQDEDFMGNGRV
eukprot:Em0005g222a